jgi:hypothetical protein
MKDKRYETVKILIENGHVMTIVKLFDTIPISVVAKDFGTNYLRFSNLVNNPEELKIKEIYTIAKLFEVDEMKVISLILNQIHSKRVRDKKS